MVSSPLLPRRIHRRRPRAVPRHRVDPVGARLVRHGTAALDPDELVLKGGAGRQADRRGPQRVRRRVLRGGERRRLGRVPAPQLRNGPRDLDRLADRRGGLGAERDGDAGGRRGAACGWWARRRAGRGRGRGRLGVGRGYFDVGAGEVDLWRLERVPFEGQQGVV